MKRLDTVLSVLLMLLSLALMGLELGGVERTTVLFDGLWLAQICCGCLLAGVIWGGLVRPREGAIP